MLPTKKPSSRVSVQPEKNVPGTPSGLMAKPWLILAIVAALPILLLLAFTFKSGYSPSGRKPGKYDKIVSVKTSTEIADQATAALQKKDTQTFLDILQQQVGSNVNMVNSKGDSLLLAAVSMGNLEATQQLILAGADVNKRNAFSKDTPLLRSLYGNNSEITRLLVYSGADINATNNYNHSPMFLALEKQKAEFIDLFLSSGVKEGLSTDYLFRATAKKNYMGVLAMLKGGVKPNVKNEKGNTPLIISASLGDVPAVQSLMAYGADVNAANNDGNTPLIYAARYNHPDVIRELLKPQMMQVPLDVNMQNKLGQTALYWGAAKGYEDVVRRLLAADADPTISANDGLVPYLVAQKNKREKVLPWFEKNLIEVKNSVIEEDNAALAAKAKAEGRDFIGEPATAAPEKPVTDDDIFKAAAEGDEELARKVIDQNKAVVFNKNKAGDTPLLVAVLNGKTNMVDLLLDNGSRLFDASGRGNVFHIAVTNNDMVMMKHLVDLARREGRLAMMLEYKARRQGYKQTFTPLGFAALDCNQEMYKYLVSMGAKPGIRTDGKNLLGIESPVDLMAKCKAKPTAAKTLKK